MFKNIFFSLLILGILHATAQPGPGGNSWGGNVGGNTLSGGSSNKLLNVKVFLEGPFSGSGMNTQLYSQGLVPAAQPFNTAPWNYTGTESVTLFPPNTVDWVLVELRDAPSAMAATPTTRLPGWPKALLINSEGYLMGFDGYKPGIGNPTISQQLFIIIRHRNHMDIMSATGLTLSNDTYFYDFTDSPTKAWGGTGALKEISAGVYGMIGGDADADGQILSSDFNSWSHDFGEAGDYLPTDFDLDGNVLTSDFNLWSYSFGYSWPVN